MKIDGVFEIKGRGTVVTGTWDGAELRRGDHVVRGSDGQQWRVVAIELFAMYIGRPIVAGRKVGLLVDRPGLEVGDEVAAASSTT